MKRLATIIAMILVSFIVKAQEGIRSTTINVVSSEPSIQIKDFSMKRTTVKGLPLRSADTDNQLLLSCYEISFTEIDKIPIIVDITDTEIINDMVDDIMGDSIETDGYFTLENSNPSVASAVKEEQELSIIITPLGVGETTIVVTHKQSGRNAEIQVSVVALCPDDNHPHAIDLGLPSGTKWACCNVGAHTPDEYGGYYAWGETEEKEVYGWENYQFAYADGNTDGIWDNTHDTGYWHCHAIGSDISGTVYDVAHVKWGDSWQMPTLAQVHELVNYCRAHSWHYYEKYDMFSSPNGQSIIFPHGGNHEYENHIKQDGVFWLSTEKSDYPSFDHDYTASCIIFTGGIAWGACNRFVGNSVRPVINSSNGIAESKPSMIASGQAIYNTYGVKVADSPRQIYDLPPGIYITNNRKIVVR